MHNTTIQLVHQVSTAVRKRLMASPSAAAARPSPKGWHELSNVNTNSLRRVQVAVSALSNLSKAGLKPPNNVIWCCDRHDRPEGMLQMCALVEALDVKTILLEQDVAGPVEDAEFRTYVKKNARLPDRALMLHAMDVHSDWFDTAIELLAKEFLKQSPQVSEENIVEWAAVKFEAMLHLTKLVVQRNMKVETAIKVTDKEKHPTAYQFDEPAFKQAQAKNEVTVFFTGVAHVADTCFSELRFSYESFPTDGLIKYAQTHARHSFALARRFKGMVTEDARTAQYVVDCKDNLNHGLWSSYGSCSYFTSNKALGVFTHQMTIPTVDGAKRTSKVEFLLHETIENTKIEDAS